MVEKYEDTKIMEAFVSFNPLSKNNCTFLLKKQCLTQLNQ
jgi:hypothetical protein